MNLLWPEYLGYTAAILSSCAFLPQVIHIWRTRSAKDVSLLTCIISVISQVLWIFYGVYFSRMAIVLGNALAFILFMSIIILKIKFTQSTGSKDKKLPPL